MPLFGAWHPRRVPLQNSFVANAVAVAALVAARIIAGQNGIYMGDYEAGDRCRRIAIGEIQEGI